MAFSWVKPAVAAGRYVFGTLAELLVDGMDNLYSSWPAMTLTASNITNLTLGNGTITGKYHAVGKTLVGATITVTFGSTTTISGTPAFTGMPFTLSSAMVDAYIGEARLLRTGVSATFGKLRYSTSTSFDVVYFPSGGNEANLSSTLPHTWATGHKIVCIIPNVEIT